MKKILSMVIMVAALSMVGCCGNCNKKAAAVEAQSTECCEKAECCEKCGNAECKGECNGECCGECQNAAAETVAPAEEAK